MHGDGPRSRQITQLSDLLNEGSRAQRLGDLRQRLDSAPQGPAATIQETQSAHGVPVQRTREFADNVTPDDQRILELVLRTDPILMAAWQWVKRNPGVLFTIRRRPGFNSINAGLGENEIFFNMSPPMVGDSDVRDDLKWVGTVVHELNLHFLPWVRVMMTQELRHNQDNIGGYDQNLLRYSQIVLGPIAADAETLALHYNADVANKRTTTFGGNHSDMGLWAAHLRGVKAVADSVEQPGSVVSKAVASMWMPLLLTGRVEDAIDRGPGAFVEVVNALQALRGYREDMTEEERRAFDANYPRILDKMGKYEAHLRNARQLPGEDIDD